MQQFRIDKVKAALRKAFVLPARFRKHPKGLSTASPTRSKNVQMYLGKQIIGYKKRKILRQPTAFYRSREKDRLFLAKFNKQNPGRGLLRQDMVSVRHLYELAIKLQESPHPPPHALDMYIRRLEWNSKKKVFVLWIKRPDRTKINPYSLIITSSPNLEIYLSLDRSTNLPVFTEVLDWLGKHGKYKVVPVPNGMGNFVSRY